DRQVQAMAGYLQQRGVAAGDRVLLYMQNSPQFIISFYAILRANAVVVPVNPMNRHAELEYLIQDTDARLMLCGLELLDNVLPLAQSGALQEVIVSAYSEYLVEATDLTLPDAVRLSSSAIPVAPGITPWQQALAAGHVPGPLTSGPQDI